MKYYREMQQKRNEQRYRKWQDEVIKEKTEAMNKSIRQILCRTLRYCRNGESNFCWICKWNKACINPKGDFFKPIVPGIKVMP